MTDISLQDAMNSLARMPSATWAERAAHAARQGLSGMRGGEAWRFYADCDPVMARLYKEYHDACRGHAHLAKEHGPDSPMTLIAADVRDSAESALNTRLLELKASPAMHRKLESLCAAMYARMHLDREQRREDRAFRQRQKNLRRRKDDAGENTRNDHLLVIFLLWMLDMTVRQTQMTYSISHSFDIAANGKPADSAA